MCCLLLNSMISRSHYIFLGTEITFIAIEYSFVTIPDLFIHLPLVDIWLISNLGMCVRSVYVYLSVGLLGHGVCICLAITDTVEQLSRHLVPVYTLTCEYSSCFNSPPAFGIIPFDSFIVAIPVGVVILHCGFS